jgi:cell wall-associated NlpC family hydrolase
MISSVTDIVADIPERFSRIPYDGSHDPDSPTLLGIEAGANCQNFAYELLRYFGRHVPHLRSSNLWDDTEHTTTVYEYQPLDLLLFYGTRDAWGAHVAIYVGNDRAIHLCRRVGLAAVWPLAQFAEYPEYRFLLGGKRALRASSGRLV